MTYITSSIKASSEITFKKFEPPSEDILELGEWIEEKPKAIAEPLPKLPGLLLPSIMTGVMGVAAVASSLFNDYDYNQRANLHGRADWSSDTTLVVKGTVSPLSLAFWNKASPRDLSYLITTNPKSKAPQGTELIVVDRSYQALLKARDLAETMDEIKLVDGNFNKIVPGLVGMDGKLGTAFNGAQISDTPGDKEMTVMSLRVAAEVSLATEQKWKGVELSYDDMLNRFWKKRTEVGNWCSDKQQKVEIAISETTNSARTAIADWIKPASP